MEKEKDDLQKRRQAMANIFYQAFSNEEKEWLKSIGIFTKRGENHGLILERDERLVKIDEASRNGNRPSFLEKILNAANEKRELTR